MIDLLFSVIIRAISVILVITQRHLHGRDGRILLHVWMIFFGFLAVLPEIVFRWLTYAAILVADTWFGHKLVGFFVVLYFFQSSIVGKNFETAVHSVFSSFTSPFMFFKYFDVDHQRKEVKTKELKTFYCMNKMTTSFFLLLILIFCKFTSESTHNIEYVDVEGNITICHWILNQTNSFTSNSGENEGITDKTCSLQLFFPV